MLVLEQILNENITNYFTNINKNIYTLLDRYIFIDIFANVSENDSTNVVSIESIFALTRLAVSPSLFQRYARTPRRFSGQLRFFRAMTQAMFTNCKAFGASFRRVRGGFSEEGPHDPGQSYQAGTTVPNARGPCNDFPEPGLWHRTARPDLHRTGPALPWRAISCKYGRGARRRGELAHPDPEFAP
jgi:hypothetical protein